jgi:pyridoxine 5-phosphate synthase
VSLFIDPDRAQIEAAAESGAPFIEMHTGRYANARGEAAQAEQLGSLVEGAALARRLGLRVNAGHGLNYQNVVPVARIEGLEELNIGHSIIARAVFTGLTEAVREMKRLIADPQ